MTKASNDKKLLDAYVPLMISAAVCNSLAAAVASSKRNLRDVVAGLIFKKDDGSRNSSHSNYVQSSMDRMQDRRDATERGDIYDLNDEVDLFEEYWLKKTRSLLGSRRPRSAFVVVLVAFRKHRRSSLMPEIVKMIAPVSA